MGRSSAAGIDPADPNDPDEDRFGPSDSSDTGSDRAGLDALAEDDPALPVDVALGEDASRPVTPDEDGLEAQTDSAGTGERRAAGHDAGGHDGADIGVDRIVQAGVAGDDEDADDPLADEDDLEAVEDAQAGEPLEDEPDADDQPGR